MPKAKRKSAGAAILDGLAMDYGVDQLSLMAHPTGVTSTALLAGPTGVKSTALLAGPTGVSETESEVAHPTEPTASTSTTNDEVRSLQLSVQTLSNQMAWFFDKLAEEEIDDEQPLTNESSSQIDSAMPIDTLTGLEQFYVPDERVATDIDGQLVNIVNNVLKKRLPDDKLKEKLQAYVRPGNCGGLTQTRVNPEIWEKLSAATKSRDLKAQRAQQAIVQVMVAVTHATNNLVASTRSDEPLTKNKMADTVTCLVDALALLGYVNQDVNQRRREDHRGDLNQAYRGLCNADTEGSAWLYGDDLTTRVKAINETNRIASSIAGRHPQTQYVRPGNRGRFGAAIRQNWPGRFRGAFLGQASKPIFRGKSYPQRGQRTRPVSRTAARSGLQRDV